MEDLCLSESIYPARFTQTFGYSDPNWSASSWFQREASLRHDMVCLLLCNLEPYNALTEIDIQRVLEIRVETERKEPDSGTSSSNTGSSDYGPVEHGFQPNTSQVETMDFEETTYRYFLLEGRTAQTAIQNKICEVYSLPKMSRQYDIFDRIEKKMIEVKVTKNWENSCSEYWRYTDDKSHTALIHVSPEAPNQWSMVGKRDEMIGREKATSFLLKRMTIMMNDLNMLDNDMNMDADMANEVMRGRYLNQLSAQWSDYLWAHKDLPLLDSDKDPELSDQNRISLLKEKELKSFIEDTSSRETEIMKFHGKILPPPMCQYQETKFNKDYEILQELLQDLRFNEDQEKGGSANEIIQLFNSLEDKEHDIFMISSHSFKNELQKDLGIKMKGTVRYDDHPDLRQKNHEVPPKLKYSPWMSNLLRDICYHHPHEVGFNSDLAKREMQSDHPMAKVAGDVVSKYFRLFGRTFLSMYVSSVKGVYSRLGGAFLVRGKKSSKRGEIALFPIYAVSNDENTKRFVSGFVLRGPTHAKSPTDRIPLITMEMLNMKCAYSQAVKKGYFLMDNFGRHWCYRVNSIMKQDPSYLTFLQNSTYLAANFIGEMTIANPNIPGNYNAGALPMRFIDVHGAWLMERCAESVMMAVLGGSQEEGALAIIRKIFMLKLNWHRGNPAYGSDLKGLADALNECLLDHPLALYFGQQIRNFLSDQ